MDLEKSLSMTSIEYYAMLVAITTGSIYLGYRTFSNLLQRRKLKNAGISDESELLMKVYELHKRINMDSTFKYDENLVLYMMRKFFEPIEMAVDIMKNIFLRKPNFITIHLTGENRVKIELSYDDEVKTREYVTKSIDRERMDKAMDFLRGQGYSCGIIS